MDSDIHGGWLILKTKVIVVCLISTIAVAIVAPILLDAELHRGEISAVFAFSGSGSGTSGDPFVITNENQLQEMNDNKTAYYVLGNNIDATATRTWNSNGAGGYYGFLSIKTFTGSFDGQNYVITNLFENIPDNDYIGLFGNVGSGGVVKNAGIENENIIGRDRTGGFIGYNAGTVSVIYSTGTVHGDDVVGGLIGYNFADISNSHSTATVSGASSVGGFVGQNSTYDSPSATILKCYSTGIVSGTNYVGGFAGTNYMTISQSYSAGSVSADNYVGGLVGYIFEGVVLNSYSTTSVNGNAAVGGLVGYAYDGNITKSYSVGVVTGVSSVGGLVGSNSGSTILNSFWDNEASGQSTSSGAGTGKTTDNMKEVRTFTDNTWSTGLSSPWDFVDNPYYDIAVFDIWDINSVSNDGYPFLTGVVPPPFIITTVGQLQAMNTNLLTDYVLGNDIDATATRTWNFASGRYAGFVPIGTLATPFVGSFDGQGYVITNLFENRSTTNYVGLFGYLGTGGTVTNVGIENENVRGQAYTGGLVGRNDGSVDNSYSTGVVRGTTYIGGFIGWQNGNATNCFSRTVVTNATTFSGGFIGYHNAGYTKNSYSTGSTLTGLGKGGLVGWYIGGTISNCFWDNQTSGLPSSAGGTGKTTENMKNVRTFTDNTWSVGLTSPWDFVDNPYEDENNLDIWDIDSTLVKNDGYPYLSWQVFLSGNYEYSESIVQLFGISGTHGKGNEYAVSVTQPFSVTATVASVVSFAVFLIQSFSTIGAVGVSKEVTESLDQPVSVVGTLGICKETSESLSQPFLMTTSASAETNNFYAVNLSQNFGIIGNVSNVQEYGILLSQPFGIGGIIATSKEIGISLNQPFAIVTTVSYEKEVLINLMQPFGITGGVGNLQSYYITISQPFVVDGVVAIGEEHEVSLSQPFGIVAYVQVASEIYTPPPTGHEYSQSITQWFSIDATVLTVPQLVAHEYDFALSQEFGIDDRVQVVSPIVFTPFFISDLTDEEFLALVLPGCGMGLAFVGAFIRRRRDDDEEEEGVLPT